MAIQILEKMTSTFGLMLKAALFSASFMMVAPVLAADVEEEDDYTLEELVSTCAACHGEDGNSTIPTNPKLAGQYESYIKHALKAYRSGERNNAIMAGFASALSDKQIAALAAYFSSQESTLQTVVNR